MKTLDFIKLGKSLPYKTNAVSFIGITISLFLILIGVNTFFTVYSQKQEPWEITASGDKTKLESKVIGQLEAISGVETVNPVIDISATVQIGEYSSQLNLKGVDSGYVGPLTSGKMFLDSDVLPVIVMNKTALNSFESEKKKIKPDENYSQLKTVIKDEKSYPAKIGGILQDNREEKLAYISLNSAKAYLASCGKAGEYTSVQLELKNSGKAKNVINTLKNMGLSGKDALPKKQETWDKWQTESIYITMAGIVILVFVVLYMLEGIKFDLKSNTSQYKTLRVLGMSMEDIGKTFALKVLCFSLVSAVCSCFIAYLVPLFLSENTGISSVFSIYLTPVSIAVLLFAVGVIAGIFYFTTKDYRHGQ